MKKRKLFCEYGSVCYAISLFKECRKRDIQDFVVKELKENGINASVINARFAMPLDSDMVATLAKEHRLLVTTEENVASGGFGEHVLAYVNHKNLDLKVQIIAIPDTYVEHGSVDILKEKIGIDADSVYRKVLDIYETMK